MRMLLLSTLVSILGCSDPDAEIEDPANAVYYWRHELQLSADEQAWMERNDVRKLYLHLFDVVRQNGQLMPRTTLTVTDLPPRDVKVIPVVFLAHDIMRDTTGLSALPRLIATRVEDMMTQNQLGAFDELQVDFDWAQSNQQRYFDLLGRLREALPTHRLSATIRLHQLTLPVPPVDYGALMVYNLGRIQDPDEPCSILTLDLLRPYLPYLRGYKLPLCTALPVYSWDLLFHQNEFRCILRGVSLTDSIEGQPAFTQISPGHYQAQRYQPIPPSGVAMNGSGRIFPGDIVRHEAVSATVLREVRQAIEQMRPSACRQIILYHLDDKQLKQYTDADIQSFYTGH